MNNTNFPKSIEMNIEVKTYDIDIACHVNNIVHIRWIEDLRAELFSQIYPLENLLEMNYYPVVISTDLKYKGQIKLFDKPLGKIFLDSYVHGVITLKVEIHNNHKLALTATQRCVLMNLITQKMFMGNIKDLVNRS